MYNRILERLNDLKIKDSDFSNSIGISNSAFAQWKKRGTIPAPLMLQRISNTLNVSVHWLLFGTLENNLDLKCLSDFDLTPESIVSRIENALELKTQNFSKKYDTAFFETISDIVSIQRSHLRENRSGQNNRTDQRRRLRSLDNLKNHNGNN